MKINTEITAALKAETSKATLYWDNQDPHNVGPAYRCGGESGGLIATGWAHISGRTLVADETLGYNVSDYFTGADGAYRGPDSDGIYPTMEV